MAYKVENSLTDTNLAYISEHPDLSDTQLAARTGFSAITIKRTRAKLAEGKVKPKFNLQALHRQAIGLKQFGT